MVGGLLVRLVRCPRPRRPRWLGRRRSKCRLLVVGALSWRRPATVQRCQRQRVVGLAVHEIAVPQCATAASRSPAGTAGRGEFGARGRGSRPAAHHLLMVRLLTPRWAARTDVRTWRSSPGSKVSLNVVDSSRRKGVCVTLSAVCVLAPARPQYRLGCQDLSRPVRIIQDMTTGLYQLCHGCRPRSTIGRVIPSPKENRRVQ